jgi:uncharacterized protein YaiE (UPF0345 family)
LLQIQNSAGTTLAKFNSVADLTVPSLITTGAAFIGNGIGSSSAQVEIGGNRTADGVAYIDFIGDTTYTDYGLRVIRGSGTAGGSAITSRGTGTFAITATEAAPITFSTTNLERVRIDSSGNVGIGVTSIVSPLQIGTSANASPQGNTGLTFRQGSGAPTAGSGYSVRWDNTQNVASDTGHIAYGFGGASGASAGYLRFSTADTERMRIDGSGNTTINAVADATTTTAARGGGYMGIPQSAAATTGAYTVVAADAGEHIYSTATRTVTIPANSSVAFPVGTVLTFIAGSGTTVTIAITTDTMYLAGAGTTGSRTLAAFGMATAVKITSTSWIISGNGLS